MDFNPQWITLVAASTAMIASIAGPYVNTQIARIQFRANVLSVNRQKWIEAMRDLIASLNSQCLSTAAMRHTVDEPAGIAIARDPELFHRMENMLRTVSKITLMLNPLEEDHRKLNDLMNEAVRELRSPPPGQSVEERIEALCRDITQVSQAILKREWLRVKRGE